MSVVFLALRASAIERGDEASHTNFLHPAEPDKIFQNDPWRHYLETGNENRQCGANHPWPTTNGGRFAKAGDRLAKAGDRWTKKQATDGQKQATD